MSKVFTVDGIEVPLDEEIFNQIRDKFKENVEIGDWISKYSKVYV